MYYIFELYLQEQTNQLLSCAASLDCTLYYICELHICTITVYRNLMVHLLACATSLDCTMCCICELQYYTCVQKPDGPPAAPVLRPWTVLCTVFVNYIYYTCGQEPDGPPAAPVLRPWTVLCTVFVNYIYYTCVQEPDDPHAGLCYVPGLYYVLYLLDICTIPVYRNLLVYLLACATALDCTMYCICELYVL